MRGGTEGKVSKAHYRELTSGEVFGTLRVLVIGRPNSGKSTLIRLLLGQLKSNLQSPERPKGYSSKYGIAMEWSHPTLPVTIHQCNISTSPLSIGEGSKPGLVKRVLKKHSRGGKDPDLKEVQVFLKSRQKKSDFSERVHLVWFVVSVLDGQNSLNAKVLAELGSHKQLPVVLIVTHCDQDPEGVQYSRNVEDHLYELLKGVPSKERVLASIVKVGNDVSNGRVDDDALSLVSVKTREHLHSRELKGTWVAAQEVDFGEKIRLSAKKIVGYKEAAIWASPAGLIPGPHQSIVGSLLTGLCRALCRIWSVPKNFKKSLKRNLASQEVYQRQIQLLVENFSAIGEGVEGIESLLGTNFVDLAAEATTPLSHREMTRAIMTSISASLSLSITPVAVAAIAEGWAHAYRNDVHSSIIVMLSLGMMVTGAILYVRALYDPGGWDESRPKKTYDKLIKEFVDLHGPDLKQNAGDNHSVSDVFNPGTDSNQIVNKLAEYFDAITTQHSVHNIPTIAQNSSHDS